MLLQKSRGIYELKIVTAHSSQKVLANFHVHFACGWQMKMHGRTKTLFDKVFTTTGAQKEGGDGALAPWKRHK